MKRFMPIIAMLSVLLLGASAHATAGPAPRAELRGLECLRALDPPARAVSITAVMRSFPGTRRLQMKVELLSRTPTASAFAMVAPPAGSQLGSWITPTSATLGQRAGDVWKVKFPVADLAAPATYRYRASFRWVGSGGHVLRAVSRLSGSCWQLELRPDLLVQSLTVEPVADHPAQARYVAVIANGGGSSARNFVVEFSDAGTARTLTVPSLAPGHTRRVAFTGPACTPSSPPTVTLDPQSQVDESDRGNDTATATCG